MSHRLKVIEALKTDRTVADYHTAWSNGGFDSWDSMMCHLVERLVEEKGIAVEAIVEQIRDRK